MKIELIPDPLEDVWDDWGIELLVTMSCAMQLVLTLFGSRRKTMKSNQVFIRFMIWSAYLLLDFVVSVTIGKLSLIPVSDYHTQENTDSELRGFLAPLLLMQLGSSDSITAHSIEDDRLGIRQVLNLVARLSSVLWILLRGWTYTTISYMYFPLLLSGLIKYGEQVWALCTALNENSGITTLDSGQETDLPKNSQNPRAELPSLGLIKTSYHRFLRLKPHIDYWIYRPLYQSLKESPSVDDLPAQDIFKITDIELGFMYDVLYTKAPVVYTWMGFVLRVISSATLISTSIVYALFCRDAFVFYINLGFTLGVMVVLITLEFYQIFALFFSDWAIIEMSKRSDKPMMMWFLRRMAPRSIKWKRWSNTLAQFDMINYCIAHKCLSSSSSRILRFHGFDKELRNFFCTTNVAIPAKLKEVIIKEIESLINENQKNTVSNNCEWTVDRNMLTIRFCETDKWSWTEKDRGFDQRIVIWHLATEILFHQDASKKGRSERRMGRLLSNYMMYILATRSHILGVTTSNIVFQHACQRLVAFVKTKESSTTKYDAERACCDLFDGKYEKELDCNKKEQTMVTNWNVLEDAKRLSEELLHTGDNRWELICSMWGKMLCFAATNCPTDCHAEQLRRGGEIITHVWLILLHKTLAKKERQCKGSE